jgi:HlyD family secretion protein
LPKGEALPKVDAPPRAGAGSPAAAPALPPAAADLSRLVDWRWYAAAGYLLILATFGIAGGWAAFARLDRAVISPGVIVAEGSRKTVQHLEGGIVQEVLVKEGQSVRAGEVLLRVDPLQSRASADLFRGQLDAALILEARLRAEQASGARLDLPPEIAERRGEAAVARMIDDQASQLAERQASFQLQLSLTEAKITQLRTEMSGLAVEKTAVEQQVALIQQELEGLRALREKDLIPLSRVLMMERERTRLSGVIGRSVAETAKAQNGINEAGMQAAQLRQKRQEALTAQLLETRQRIVELREKLVVVQDVLRRHEIRASHPGVIQDLKVYTLGQVIRSGEPLMEIVPTSDRLVVSVQFAPNDLEAVQAGMRAEIKFPAFQSRRMPTLLGTVTLVSRDRLLDERTKQPYFAGTVEIDERQLPETVRPRLVAGLPAEITVSAGERTALEYLLGPFFDALGRAFHER